VGFIRLLDEPEIKALAFDKGAMGMKNLRLVPLRCGFSECVRKADPLLESG
jgi:hypothetical protein